MQPRTTPRLADGDPLIYTCPHATCAAHHPINHPPIAHVRPNCLPRQLRAAGNQRPLLVIAPRGLKWPGCLNAGADAYLDSSFLPALVRRARFSVLGSRLEVLSPQLEVGDLRLDPVKLTAYRGETAIALTPRETRLLQVLMEKPGKVFSRKELLKAVWGADFAGSPNVVNENIKRLRKKVDWGYDPRRIETVPWKGYVVRAE